MVAYRLYRRIKCLQHLGSTWECQRLIFQVLHQLRGLSEASDGEPMQTGSINEKIYLLMSLEEQRVASDKVTLAA